MIYYKKTLFGSGPKLTAVHPELLKVTLKYSNFTFYLKGAFL
ncbi:hypothetical protein M2123_002078 [Polynucleobacter sphagniphilus]|jgi:hypothetical protein|nr:hypothetical protein [Polynucleobacter sphagniphilus]